MEKFRPQRLKLDACSYKVQEAWVHGFKAKYLKRMMSKRKNAHLLSIMETFDIRK